MLQAYLSLRESSDSKVSGVGALAGEGHRMVQRVAQMQELLTCPARGTKIIWHLHAYSLKIKVFISLCKDAIFELLFPL